MLIKSELRFIEILREMKRFNPDKLDEIEEALKRGEKFEKMWGEHEKEIKYLSADAHYKGAKILMERIKQKYFPKPIKKTITINIESKNKIDMKWFLDRLTSFKEQIVVDLPYTKIEIKGEIK